MIGGSSWRPTRPTGLPVRSGRRNCMPLHHCPPSGVSPHRGSVTISLPTAPHPTPGLLGDSFLRKTSCPNPLRWADHASPIRSRLHNDNTASAMHSISGHVNFPFPAATSYTRPVHAWNYHCRQQQLLPEHDGGYFGTRSAPWDGQSWWPQWIGREVKVVAGTELQEGYP